jgi:mannose-6-phosphate isomerase-like protein (cupin superfamily)
MSKNIDLRKVRGDWEHRGFTFGVWEDPPGKTWEDFSHEEDELFMVIEGDMELEINERLFHPEPGQEVFIPAKMYHSVRNLGKKECRYAYGYRQKGS